MGMVNSFVHRMYTWQVMSRLAGWEVQLDEIIIAGDPSGGNFFFFNIFFNIELPIHISILGTKIV